MQIQKYIKNFFSNIIIFISSIFLILIFSSPNIYYIPIGVIICALIGGFLCSKEALIKEAKKSNLFVKIYSLISALIIDFSLGHCFYSFYYNKDIKVFTAEMTIIYSIILSILSLIVTYVLINLLFSYLISKQLSLEAKAVEKDLFKNLVSNLFLWLCGFCYVMIQMETVNLSFVWPSILIATAFIGIFLTLKPKLLYSIKEFKFSIRFWAGVCAFGGCIFSSDIFRKICDSYFSYHFKLPDFLDKNTFISVFSLIVFVCSIIFLWVVISYFYDAISPTIKRVLKGITKIEYFVAGFIAFFLLILATYVYTQSDIFYDNMYRFDLVYTGDSGEITNANTFEAINSIQNDLRQGLFAVFSIPFTGVLSAFAYILSFYRFSNFLFLEYSQVLMLVFGVLIFVNMFKLSTIKRIFILLFTFSVYPTLLYSIMIEQYVMAFFWLMFYVALYINYKEDNEIAYLGATACLTTSGLIRFLCVDKFSLESIKDKFLMTIKSIATYIVICFTFSRLQFFVLLGKNLKDFKEFSGSDVTFLDKIMQYINFVASCFVAPAGGTKLSTLNSEHYTWAMNDVTTFNVLGIIILLIVIISFILNRKDTLAKISFYWIAFSVVLLVIMGWGTAENGLILYTLYFSWAFIVLIIKLFEFVSEKIKFKHLTPIALGVFSVVFVVLNMMELVKIIDFAIIWKTMIS